MKQRKPALPPKSLSPEARKALERELWKLLLTPRPTRKENTNDKANNQAAIRG